MEEVEKSKEDELKRSILDGLANCIHCRFCLRSCPLFEITDGWERQGASGISTSLYNAVKWGLEEEYSDALRDLLFSCTTCKNCVLACEQTSMGVDLLDGIKKGRQLFVEKMIGLMPQQKGALESLIKYSNPYGNMPAERANWAKGLDIPTLHKETDLEVLYYVGCTPSYDERIQSVAKAIVQLLKKAQIPFGILGDEESCCGCPADRIGEEALFQELAKNNLEQFKSLGVRRIITTSPHCYDTFVNLYPKEIKNGIKIEHYTQFFSDLIDKGKLSFKNSIKKKVTYQDPCYLGRHNNIYEEPRKILRSIPGIKLVEMKRARTDSLCCGGGGGRMWADFSEEKARLGDIRAREALEVGAEIIVTACPFCLINIEDAIKTGGLENRLEVKDLAELMLAGIDKGGIQVNGR